MKVATLTQAVNPIATALLLGLAVVCWYSGAILGISGTILIWFLIVDYRPRWAVLLFLAIHVGAFATNEEHAVCGQVALENNYKFNEWYYNYATHTCNFYDPENDWYELPLKEYMNN